MMLAVIDTNVLVSALLSPNGAPAKVWRLIVNDIITVCYDYRIINEYQNVLRRPKFNFSPGEINWLLDFILTYGYSIIPQKSDIVFIDESDKKFYEISKSCNAILITGNIKHFPTDKNIMTVTQFLENYKKILQ